MAENVGIPAAQKKSWASLQFRPGDRLPVKATAWEFRYRVVLIVAMYVLGFAAPWLRFGADANSNPPRLWSWLAIWLARTGTLSLNASYLSITAAAVILAVAGAVLRLWGTAYLTPATMRAASFQAAAVVASGPYRHLRNPLYLGLLLTSAAIAILMPASGATVFLALMILFTARLIAAEQSFLENQLGEGYRAYRSHVPPLWPSFRPRVPSSVGHPHWKQAAVAEFFSISTAVSFAMLAWRYDADLLTRAIIVCFGLSMILQALTSGRKLSTREP